MPNLPCKVAQTFLTKLRALTQHVHRQVHTQGSWRQVSTKDSALQGSELFPSQSIIVHPVQLSVNSRTDKNFNLQVWRVCRMRSKWNYLHTTGWGGGVDIGTVALENNLSNKVNLSMIYVQAIPCLGLRSRIYSRKFIASHPGEHKTRKLKTSQMSINQRINKWNMFMYSCGGAPCVDECISVARGRSSIVSGA